MNFAAPVGDKLIIWDSEGFPRSRFTKRENRLVDIQLTQQSHGRVGSLTTFSLVKEECYKAMPKDQPRPKRDKTIDEEPASVALR